MPENLILKTGRLAEDELPDASGDSEEQNETLESWADFLRRTARWSEVQMQKAGQKEWLHLWRGRQWDWMSKIMTTGRDKWSAVFFNFVASSAT